MLINTLFIVFFFATFAAKVKRKPKPNQDDKFFRLYSKFPLKEYPPIDGVGNNKYYQNWGASFTEKLRIAPQELPGHFFIDETTEKSPREISNKIFDQPDGLKGNAYDLTSWVWVWGQFIDHDVAAETDLGGHSRTQYCNRLIPSSICDKPIPTPLNDPIFSGHEIPFTRSPYNIGKNTFKSKKKYGNDATKHPTERKYLNIITHFIDGSTVYGSTTVDTEYLRDLTASGHGRLKTDESGLFPFMEKKDIFFTNGVKELRFQVGDTRGNENRILTSVHTLFLREHNRIADLLWCKRGRKPCNRWCNDQIFNDARVYVMALIQKITLYDWLPLFLGHDFWDKHVGDYNGYDHKINPSLTMEYSVAAYRIGHTMVNDQLLRVNENYEEILGGPQILSDLFFQEASSFTFEPEQMKSLILGLGAQEAEERDRHVVDSLRNMLFGKGRAAFDLTSLNIQRGRDNGLSRFGTTRTFLCNYWLKYPKPNKKKSRICKPYTRFSDFPASNEIKNLLKEVYKQPEDIELFTAGIIEEHTPGGHLGETFGLIIADQFKRLRDGDRFWFENYLPKSMIRNIFDDTLAKVIERNVGVKPKQDDVFLMYNP